MLSGTAPVTSFFACESELRGAVILVGNRCPVQKGTTGLGIGLRLVHALAEPLPETCLATRQTAHCWVRMQAPYGTPAPVQLMQAGARARANSAVV